MKAVNTCSILSFAGEKKEEQTKNILPEPYGILSIG